MWKLFFEICDILCGLIPNRHVRRRIRTQKLFDWRNKYRALRKRYPNLNFRHTRMIKGGWNIGFIVDNKYVFKIRKFYDSSIPAEKIMREKRITDAFANISPLHIPKIEIVRAGKYTFYKYDFIPGKNMNTCSQRVIERNAWQWGADIIKLFPADDLGCHYIKNVKAPLSHIPLLATGGVNPDTIPLFLEAGAVGVGTGISIAKPELIAARDFDGIADLARAHVEAVHRARV